MPKVDWPAFNSLIGSDKKLFAELLKLYSEDWPVLIRSIEVSVADKDHARIEISAHRLKGMVRNFFSEKTADLAGKLEDLALQRKDLSEAKEILVELKSCLKEIENELKAKIVTLK